MARPQHRTPQPGAARVDHQGRSSLPAPAQRNCVARDEDAPLAAQAAVRQHTRQIERRRVGLDRSLCPGIQTQVAAGGNAAGLPDAAGADDGQVTAGAQVTGLLDPLRPLQGQVNSGQHLARVVDDPLGRQTQRPLRADGAAVGHARAGLSAQRPCRGQAAQVLQPTAGADAERPRRGADVAGVAHAHAIAIPPQVNGAGIHTA